jgi:hypothetical protein
MPICTSALSDDIDGTLVAERASPEGSSGGSPEYAETVGVIAYSGSLEQSVRAIRDQLPRSLACAAEDDQMFDEVALSPHPNQAAVVATNRDFIMRQSTGVWAQFEPRLLVKYDAFNDTHFSGLLPHIEIRIGQCSSPRTVYGQYFSRADHGMYGMIVLNQRLFTNDMKGVYIADTSAPGFHQLIDDILLHEMVHAYCHLIIEKPEVSYRGHGPVFTTECNRIGKTLGVKSVKHAKSQKSSEMHMESCAYWPHAVRPRDYYKGAIEHVKATPDVPKAEDLACLIDMDAVGPRELIMRLYKRATNNMDTPRGLADLGKALIGGLRLILGNDDALPQYSKDYRPPMTVADEGEVEQQTSARSRLNGNAP